MVENKDKNSSSSKGQIGCPKKKAKIGIASYIPWSVIYEERKNDVKCRKSEGKITIFVGGKKVLYHHINFLKKN